MDIKHGFAFQGEHFADAGTHIVLTPGNFFEEGGFKSKADKEKWYTGPIPTEYVLKEGDLIVAMTEQGEGLLGSSAIIPRSGLYLHNQRLGLVQFRDEPETDRRFVYYLFNSKPVRQQIRASASGAKIRHTAPSRIAAVKVHVPPLPDQRRISGILSAYDDLIENNTRRIRILEEMAQALYREWFVHFRFPGHEKVKKVESALGRMPEGWEVKRLAAACEIVMGQSPKSEFYNQIGEGLPFHRGVTDFGAHFPVDRVYCTVQNRLAERGDILFSVRAPVGRINVAGGRMVLGRGLCAIRFRETGQHFVLYQLKQKFREEDTMGGGTIFKAVTKEDVHGIELIVPANSLLHRFEQQAESITRQIAILTTKNTNLRTTRDLLLPKLISGEIDVSRLDLPAPGGPL